jgi:hypothetical protein
MVATNQLDNLTLSRISDELTIHGALTEGGRTIARITTTTGFCLSTLF